MRIFFHLLKQWSVKLTDIQTRWLEKLIPYVNLMRIIYMKGVFNEAAPVSRRLNFLRIDDGKFYNTQDSLWWDKQLHDVSYNDSEPAILALQ